MSVNYSGSSIVVFMLAKAIYIYNQNKCMLNNQKKTAWLSITLVATLLMVFFLSCSEETLNDSDFLAGETFTDSDIRILKLDTMTVVSSTMKFDSINTSDASRMLVGKYTDPVFGKVRTSSFLQFLPTDYSIDPEAVYDNIAIFLKYDDYYYNDTLQSNTIHFRELTEVLQPNDGINFYNTSTIDFATEDLGVLSYNPRPLESDSLEIKLSDDLGLALFDNLQQNVLTNDDEFINFFKGMTLQPNESDDGSIIGFSLASSVMRLYYTVSEENGQVHEYTDFFINTFSSPVPFFNQIVAEEPIEYLQGFTDTESHLNSIYPDNLSYIQSGIGITSRIQFPNIKSIYDIQGQGTLLNALLKITPEKGSYTDDLDLKDTLSVFVVDRNNELSSQLFSASGSTVYAILNRDNQEFNEIYYEIPLTNYIEGLLTTDYENDEALILLPDDYNATVDRVILKGEKGSDNGTSLELTYAIYDEDE